MRKRPKTSKLINRFSVSPTREKRQKSSMQQNANKEKTTELAIETTYFLSPTLCFLVLVFCALT